MAKYKDWAYKKNRGIVLARDGYKCRYCGAADNLHTHHIRPLSKGGNHEIYNLITLCSECHHGDHEHINAFGLAAIPGPEFESFKDYLTDKEDINSYHSYLIEQNISPEF